MSASKTDAFPLGYRAIVPTSQSWPNDTVAAVEEPASPYSPGGNSFNTSLSSVAYYAFTGGMHKPRVKHHLAMKVNL